MKVALMVVCWFSFQQAIFGIESPMSECELKCPEGVCLEGDGWLYPNMVLSGGTFLTIPGISTARMCQFQCAVNPDCEFFTQDKACELKNRNTGDMLSKQKDGAISGVKCIEGSPMQYDTDYVGADIGRELVADEIDCQRKCKEWKNAGCKYWTFDQGSGFFYYCFLKENYGWTIRKKEIAISGAGF